MDNEKTKLIQELGELMSDISERCYYAGWLGGTEYFVPVLCRRALETNNAQPWGHGEVTPNDAKSLTDISDKLGNWVNLDEAGIGYEEFNPFPIPKEYLENLDRELKIGKQKCR
jgi:hypothetical protein